MPKVKILILLLFVLESLTLTVSSMTGSEVEIRADEIAGDLYLGQVYPSGNIYLKAFYETIQPRSFWPDRITYHSLMSRHPAAAKFYEASFVKVMKDRKEKTGYGHRVYPVYIPYEEGMQKDVCNRDKKFHADPSKQYLDSGDFFDSQLLHCEANEGVAVYRGIPNQGLSFKVVAFGGKFELENPELLSGSTLRPLTLVEAQKVDKQKKKTKKMEDNGECTTVTRYPDEAQQYFTAEIKDSDFWIRISMYQSPGCAGHLARHYMLDILKGAEPEKTFVLVKYEGVI